MQRPRNKKGAQLVLVRKRPVPMCLEYREVNGENHFQEINEESFGVILTSSTLLDINVVNPVNNFFFLRIILTVV